MLATKDGLCKTTREQMLAQWFKGEVTNTVCHLSDSMFLVAFKLNKLIVWDEALNQQLLEICTYSVVSIQRVHVYANTFLLKGSKGVKVLTLRGLSTK